MWAALLVIAGYGVIILWAHWRWRRMKAERSHITLDDFRQEFKDTQYNEMAIEVVFHDLTDFVGHPVWREDNLANTLGLLADDFYDMAQRRALQLGVTDLERSPYTRFFPAHTVEDYVRLLSEIIMTKEEGSS